MCPDRRIRKWCALRGTLGWREKAMSTMIQPRVGHLALPAALRAATTAAAECPVQPCSIPVQGLSRDIRVKIASTRDEWAQAFQLVADNYQSRGYEAPGGDLRFTSYHALPDTVTFVAKCGARVIGTFSLVPDNTLLGLPIESIYSAEIKELRPAGRHLAEVTNLALRDLSLREFHHVFVALIRLMKQYHVRQGGDTWLITVNPRHRNYYCNTLGYIPFGSRRAYPAVGNHPAEALLVDVPLMRASAAKMYGCIFAESLPKAALNTPRMPPQLVRLFGGNSSQTDIRFVDEILRYLETAGSPRRW
jgi:hypothetical protein